MYERHISSNLLSALANSPVVLLHGARQTGKSTLVQHLASSDYPARYFTFDDLTVLSAATSDPVGFLAGVEGPIVLDEIQRVPQLFLPIKAEVDRHRRPGRFILTGSANVLMLPRLSESLAGRMEILRLQPLSQGELVGRRERFIDLLFEEGPGRFQSGLTNSARSVIERILRGGYPPACDRDNWTSRAAWFNSYVTTILQRDVRDLSNIEGLETMPRLLMLLASRAGAILNHAEVSRSLGMPLSTLKRYMTLLEATFLVQLLPAWSGNLGKRLTKSPKVYLCDTGLASALLRQGDEQALRDSHLLGPMMENFVVMELFKQVAWSKTEPALFHLRTVTGQEVDVVLESPSGELAGIEIKAGASVNAEDFRGLRTLAEETGKRFRCGVILYRGRETVPFGRNLYALPVEAVWEA